MDALALTKTYIQQLKTQGISIAQAYLFGSYAKGKVWEGSDIDVCVVSSNFGKDYFSEKRLLNKIALRIDSRIEPVPYTPNDFVNKYDALADEIKRFGIKIA